MNGYWEQPTTASDAKTQAERARFLRMKEALKNEKERKLIERMDMAILIVDPEERAKQFKIIEDDIEKFIQEE